jgi:YD repeat-containing protein
LGGGQPRPLHWATLAADGVAPKSGLSVGGITTTEYDQYGRLAKTSDPTGTVTYVHDRAIDPRDVLTGLTDSGTGTVGARYDADGQPTTTLYPGGATRTDTQDANGRTVARAYTRDSDGTSIYSQTLTIDGQDRIASDTYTGGSKTYSYDRLSRLVKTEHTSMETCTVRGYGYDARSNRQTESGYDPAADGSGAKASGAGRRWAWRREFENGDGLAEDAACADGDDVVPAAEVDILTVTSMPGSGSGRRGEVLRDHGEHGGELLVVVVAVDGGLLDLRIELLADPRSLRSRGCRIRRGRCTAFTEPGRCARQSETTERYASRRTSRLQRPIRWRGSRPVRSRRSVGGSWPRSSLHDRSE